MLSKEEIEAYEEIIYQLRMIRKELNEKII